MRNQWDIWIIVLTALVVILLIMNLSGNQRATSLVPNDLDEERAHVFLEEQAELPADGSPAPQTVTPPVATPVVKIEPTVLPVSSSAPVEDNRMVAYAIQVASFKDLVNAQEEEKKALASGLDAYVAAVDLGEKGQWYRLYIGKCQNRAEADALLAKVKSLYPGSFIIVPKK